MRPTTRRSARRSGHDLFVDLATLSRDKGLALIASAVATPEALRTFPEIVDRLRPAGLHPVPKLVRGPFAGWQYPED